MSEIATPPHHTVPPDEISPDDLSRNLDPFVRFDRWLPAPYANGAAFALMTLSTVDDAGYPEGRTVLLSSYDEAGFCFHTDSRSRKVSQVRADPRACLTLAWPEIARQVVIQGDVDLLTEEANHSGYRARPRYLQLLAWINSPEHAQLAPALRKAAFAELDAAHAEPPTPPATWIGFQLQPIRMVFWQGAADASSIRLEYRRTGSGWRTALLPG